MQIEILTKIEDIDRLKLTEDCPICKEFRISWGYGLGFIAEEQCYKSPKGRKLTRKIKKICDRCKGKGYLLTNLGNQLIKFIKENSECKKS